MGRMPLRNERAADLCCSSLDGVSIAGDCWDNMQAYTVAISIIYVCCHSCPSVDRDKICRPSAGTATA